MNVDHVTWVKPSTIKLLPHVVVEALNAAIGPPVEFRLVIDLPAAKSSSFLRHFRLNEYAMFGESHEPKIRGNRPLGNFHLSQRLSKSGKLGGWVLFAVEEIKQAGRKLFLILRVFQGIVKLDFLEAGEQVSGSGPPHSNIILASIPGNGHATRHPRRLACASGAGWI